MSDNDVTLAASGSVPRRHLRRWAAVMIALQAAHGVATNLNFHWETYAEYIFSPFVILGVGWTLLLTVVAMAVAIPLALALVVMRESGNPILTSAAWFWVWFFRGTPVYTQLPFFRPDALDGSATLRALISSASLNRNVRRTADFESAALTDSDERRRRRGPNPHSNRPVRTPPITIGAERQSRKRRRSSPSVSDSRHFTGDSMETIA